MSFEIWLLLISVVLLFVQIMVQATYLNRQLGLDYNASARDDDKPLTGKAGRAKRALANFLETYPAFIALALAVEVTGASDWLTQAGGLVYILGRVAYVPLYLNGVPVIRSLAFAVASLGLAGMAIGLVV